VSSRAHRPRALSAAPFASRPKDGGGGEGAEATDAGGDGGGGIGGGNGKPTLKLTASDVVNAPPLAICTPSSVSVYDPSPYAQHRPADMTGGKRRQEKGREREGPACDDGQAW